MASSKAPCVQGARTLLSLINFGFTCTAKIKEPELAACFKGDNIGDIGVASAPEIPNGTNVSTSAGRTERGFVTKETRKIASKI